MPTDPEFVRALVATLESRGAQVSPLQLDHAPSPLPIGFVLRDKPYRALLYVRRLTPQRGAGTDHNRGADEWHAQMIFDNSLRGRGTQTNL